MSELPPPVKPLVDIILPTNRGMTEYLAAAIASVEAQTWRNWTLTLIDDGGPDPRDLDRFVETIHRATVVHQEPSGTSAARNAGMAITRGELVVFLDDDDMWEPNRLEKQVAALEGANAATGSYCGGTYVDGRGRTFGRGWPAHQVSSREFLCGQVPMPRIVTMMVRRSAFESVGGFDESYGTGQDLEFTLRLLTAGEMVSVPESLVLYRRHDHNVSQPGSLAGRQAIKRMLVEQKRRARANGDISAALLLAQHLRSRRNDFARDAVAGTIRALRAQEISVLREEAGYLIARPGIAAREVGKRIATKIRSGRPHAEGDV